jgi:hypothetical protein
MAGWEIVKIDGLAAGLAAAGPALEERLYGDASGVAGSPLPYAPLQARLEAAQ